ncbi:hypothetical protein OKW35_002220 [Paraburkholderia sp. MM5477-R1]
MVMVKRAHPNRRQIPTKSRERFIEQHPLIGFSSEVVAIAEGTGRLSGKQTSVDDTLNHACPWRTRIECDDGFHHDNNLGGTGAHKSPKLSNERPHSMTGPNAQLHCQGDTVNGLCYAAVADRELIPPIVNKRVTCADRQFEHKGANVPTTRKSDTS